MQKGLSSKRIVLAQIHYPQHLSPRELDSYLEIGWFRMGQAIFTTNFLNFNSHHYSAIWLRVLLNELEDEKAFVRLRKLNSEFRIEIKEAIITDEKEALFASYKESVPFNASSSLQQLLYGKTSTTTIFHTYEVNLFDGKKLIAVGYFDLGDESAAGISSFYDPLYKKNSLGKYLIYLKMEYCKTMRLKYFYPGYFAPGYKAFDYKLSMGKTALEYFQLKSSQWVRLENYEFNETPIVEMRLRLQSVIDLLPQHLNYRIYNYEFFDANLVPDLKGVEVFDFPLFICGPNDHERLIGPVVIYDVRDRLFHMLRCYSLWKSEMVTSVDVYAAHLLKIQQYVFSTAFAVDMAGMIGQLQQNEFIHGRTNR